MNIGVANKLFRKAIIQISDLQFYKVPKKWNFVLKIDKVNVKLDINTINLLYEKGLDNEEKIIQTDFDQDNIISNALKILRSVQDFMQNYETTYKLQVSKSPKKSAPKMPKKYNIGLDETRDFVQNFFMRALSIIIMKSLYVEISNIKLEIIQSSPEDLELGNMNQFMESCLMKIQLQQLMISFKYLKVLYCHH